MSGLFGTCALLRPPAALQPFHPEQSIAAGVRVTCAPCCRTRCAVAEAAAGAVGQRANRERSVPGRTGRRGRGQVPPPGSPGGRDDLGRAQVVGIAVEGDGRLLVARVEGDAPGRLWSGPRRVGLSDGSHSGVRELVGTGRGHRSGLHRLCRPHPVSPPSPTGPGWW
jgi:hypothetical protein